MVVNGPVSEHAVRVLEIGEICERSERATENKKKRLGGNFKFSGCGILPLQGLSHVATKMLGVFRKKIHLLPID